jgi:hypothetical protein
LVVAMRSWLIGLRGLGHAIVSHASFDQALLPSEVRIGCGHMPLPMGKGFPFMFANRSFLQITRRNRTIGILIGSGLHRPHRAIDRPPTHLCVHLSYTKWKHRPPFRSGWLLQSISKSFPIIAILTAPLYQFRAKCAGKLTSLDARPGRLLTQSI